MNKINKSEIKHNHTLSVKMKPKYQLLGILSIFSTMLSFLFFIYIKAACPEWLFLKDLLKLHYLVCYLLPIFEELSSVVSWNRSCI